MAKNEQTSKRVGGLAAQQLANPNTPANQKAVDASALTQRPDKKGQPAKPPKKAKGK